MRPVRIIVLGFVGPLAACRGSSEEAGTGDAGSSAEESGGDGEDSQSGSGEGSGDGEAEAGDGDGDGDGSGPVKFDTLAVPDAAVGCGDGGGDDTDFSYIWIANSAEGTITKLNTDTLIEEGRYRVRPDGSGSPSRTSVNLSGDVAVASRMGGMTKFHARAEDCAEQNGMPGIQTSTGKNDVLAWANEECRAWYTPFNYTTQRPVAWTAGVLDEGTCSYQDQKVWTSAAFSGQGMSLEVFRLDGEDGTIEEQVALPDVPAGYFGAYGGAVDGDDDFWFINYDTPRKLVQVDHGDLSYEVWDVPNGVCSYGFTVDSQGRPWIGAFCGAGSVRFDPNNETWATIPNVFGYGIQEDADGVMWLATFSPAGLRAIDSDTLQVGKQIVLPTGSARGVSIDFYGYVWFVDMTNSAFRVDTELEMWDVYAGLTGPYTYSDMTGWGLSNVANPQG